MRRFTQKYHYCIPAILGVDAANRMIREDAEDNDDEHKIDFGRTLVPMPDGSMQRWDQTKEAQAQMDGEHPETAEEMLERKYKENSRKGSKAGSALPHGGKGFGNSYGKG